MPWSVISRFSIRSDPERGTSSVNAENEVQSLHFSALSFLLIVLFILTSYILCSSALQYFSPVKGSGGSGCGAGYPLTGIIGSTSLLHPHWKVSG